MWRGTTNSACAVVACDGAGLLRALAIELGR